MKPNAKRGKAKQKTGPITKTRKELRKEKRKEKKYIKHLFFSKKKAIFNKRDSSLDTKEDESKKTNNVKPVKPTVSLEQLKREKEEKAAIKKRKNEKEMHRVRVKQLREANFEEDKLIKKLEKNLKLNKRKSKSVPKSFAVDGLDYLLEVCDQEKLAEFASAENNLHESGSEFEEDFAMATGKQRANKKSDVDSGHDSHEDYDDFSSDDSFSDLDVSDDDLTEGVTDNVAAILNKVFKSKLGDDKVSKKKRKMTGEGLKDVDGKKNKKKQKTVHFDDDSDKGFSDENLSKETKVKKDSKKKKSVRFDENLVEEKTTEENFGKKKKTKSDKRKKAIDCEESLDSLDGNNRPINKKSKESKLKRDTKLKSSSFEEDFESSCDDLDVGVVDSEDEEQGESEIADKSASAVWEDIYGRTRDKAGNVVPSAKYVPPALRAQNAGGDKALLRLRTQMKGLLNRLAENNLKSIADQVEGFYMTNSRYDTSQSLTELLSESLVAPVMTPDRLVAEHVMLVAILHANVGTEVGAHFLQAIVTRFSSIFASSPEVADKNIDNLLLVIAHMYNFKMFASVLAYDILDKLAEKFGEKEVQLILLFLKTVGANLRKDDPLALKDLISRLQLKAGTVTNAGDNTRVRFMMDVLLAIKNNNMTKIPNYDTSHADHLKKLVKAFLRPGNYVSELKISLQDLLKADERGRWWVVGSAWSGADPKPLSGPTSQSTAFSTQVLALAKQQRMNTDVRRNIFCIIMTAEDYLDAFEKLLHLSLKNQQEREIVHVILDCCLQEKVFNPYYVHLAHKFCVFDRKYQMAVQYLLWDKLKELNNMASVQLTNLAKFLSHMFIEPQGLPLSVLKVIHFAEVDKPTVRLVRQTLLGLLLTESTEACLAVFARVAQAEKLRLFREGLRLFLHHFVMKNTKTLPPDDLIKLQERIKMADSALSINERNTLF